MSEAYIIDAVRSPVGRRRGALSAVHPADLGAHVLTSLLDRTTVDPNAIDDVVFGCLDTVGPQAGNIARTAWLAANLPEAIPGVTVDRQCGSSQQAVHFAALGVMSGTQDLVIAGGVQNMSMVPIGYSMTAAKPLGIDDPFSGSVGWQARYGTQMVSQFLGAEMMAERWQISREEMESFAYESHQRAIRAIDEGRFKGEIVPYGEMTEDEGPRRDTNQEKMSNLDPLMPKGRITAAMASQISDGAAALLIASEEAVKAHGLRPRARIHHLSVRGDDPIMMLSAPIPATAYALEKTGLSIQDMDVVEINEAFAPVPMAWLKHTGADPDKLNVNGGAIALGHPLGASGTKLMSTLVHALKARGKKYGLQTMCEGGGVANVTIIEAL